MNSKGHLLCLKIFSCIKNKPHWKYSLIQPRISLCFRLYPAILQSPWNSFFKYSLVWLQLLYLLSIPRLNLISSSDLQRILKCSDILKNIWTQQWLACELRFQVANYYLWYFFHIFLSVHKTLKDWLTDWLKV